jgi:hypothetical protein
MTSRLIATVLFLALALVGPPIVSAQPPPTEIIKADAIDLPFGKANWDMHQLDQDPVKLTKVSALKVRIRQWIPSRTMPGMYEPLEFEETLVNFILELQRDVTVRDIDWTGVRPQPPFRFQFEDAAGVILTTEPAEYGDSLVGPRGRLAILPEPRVDGAEFGGKLVTLKGRKARVVLVMPDPRIMGRTKKVVVDLKPYGS